MRPYGNQKQLEKRRRRAIELLKDGMSVTAVARQIGSSHSSVILWRDQYNRHGPDALRPKPVSGRPSKLHPRQKKRVTKILLKGAAAWGFPTDLWTQKRIATVIEKEFGVAYHPHHLWRFLTNLGWSCQKPQKRAREQDEKAVQRWKQYVWPHIKKG